MSMKDKLTRKIFRVKTLEEIRKVQWETNIHWNEKEMAKYCGMELEMLGPVKENFHGDIESHWVYRESDRQHWIFPPIWLDDPILPKELFEI